MPRFITSYNHTLPANAHHIISFRIRNHFGSSMDQSIRQYADVNFVASRNDGRELERLVVTVHDFFSDHVLRFVTRHHGHVLVCSYFADGTPAKVRRRVVRSLAGMRRVTRHGFHGLEFIAQVALLVAIDAHGVQHCGSIGVPSQVPYNNNVDDNFSAARIFLPLLRTAGAWSVSIQHCVFDHKFCLPLCERIEAFCEMQYSPVGVHKWSPGCYPVQYYQMLEWFVSFPCIFHFCNNALCWGVCKYSSKDIMKALFVALSALRSSFDSLTLGFQYVFDAKVIVEQAAFLFYGSAAMVDLHGRGARMGRCFCKARNYFYERHAFHRRGSAA